MSSRRNRRLLNEVSYYPDYMSFSLSEMEELLNSFVDIFKSIWSSIKLAWATIELNLKVVIGTWTKNKKMVADAFSDFQTSRQKYDKEMSDNLYYFKKYYLESRVDTLGGFGPGVLALAANPALFLAGRTAGATVARGEGEAAAFDTDKGFRSTFFALSPDSGRGDADSSGTGSGKAPPKTGRTKTTKNRVITPRLRRALDFFMYDASLISEAVEVPQPQNKQVEEMQKMQEIAASYVKTETENSKKILSKISNINAAMKELLDAKTFEELVQVMRRIDQSGIKMSTQGIQTASKNIRAEFQKQQKEDPEKFKQAVELMQQRSPGIKGPDLVESAMKFVFGVSKTKMQQQLIAQQEELQGTARRLMNLPIDTKTKAKLQTSEIGKQYLAMLDDFERKLEDGERETSAAKKSLKNEIT